MPLQPSLATNNQGTSSGQSRDVNRLGSTGKPEPRCPGPSYLRTLIVRGRMDVALRLSYCSCKSRFFRNRTDLAVRPDLAVAGLILKPKRRTGRHGHGHGSDCLRRSAAALPLEQRQRHRPPSPLLAHHLCIHIALQSLKCLSGQRCCYQHSGYVQLVLLPPLPDT